MINNKDVKTQTLAALSELPKDVGNCMDSFIVKVTDEVIGTGEALAYFSDLDGLSDDLSYLSHELRLDLLDLSTKYQNKLRTIIEEATKDYV